MTHIPNEPIDPHRPHTTHYSYEPPRPTTVGTQYIPVPAQPGSVPLRPLNFSDFLSGLFKSFAYSPSVYIAASLAGSVSCLIVAASLYFYSLAGAVIALIFATYAVGAISISVTRGVAGHRTSLRQSLKLTVRSFVGIALQLGVLGILLFFITSSNTIGIFLMMLIADVYQHDPSVTWVLAAFFICLVLAIGLAFFFVNFAVGPAAAAVERVGLFRSLKRSWRLVRKRYWRVLGTTLLSVVGVQAAIGIFGALLTTVAIPLIPVIALLVGDGLTSGAVYLLVVLLGLLVGAVLIAPCLGLVVINVLQYIDLRFRHEGLHHVIANEDAAGQKPFIPGTSAYASAMR